MYFLQCLAFESPALDLDITMFIQLGLFIIVMLALRKFVLAPYLLAYDERQKLTDGAREEAEALTQKAEDAKKEYESERQKAYNEVESLRKAELAKANAAAAETLEKARVRIQEDIAGKQAEFDAQLLHARHMADIEITAISEQIANKILV